MNELLQAIKIDLTSRRLLPLLVLFAVGLLGALAYAVLGGNSSAKPPAPIAAAPLPGGLPVTPAPPNATQAASETPGGVHYQTTGPTRNPFKPLVAPPVLPSTSGAGSSNGNSAGGSSSGGSTSKVNSTTVKGGSPETAPAKSAPAKTVPTHHAPASKQPRKPRPLQGYTVSALFGLAPATPGQPSTLTPYEDMKQFEPLPSPKAPLLVFMGVAKSGDQALFTLTSPPILRGPALCRPTATQCQEIELSAGQDEELEYTTASGKTVAYELQVLQIAKRTATAAAKSPGQSKAGRLALLRAGLWALQ